MDNINPAEFFNEMKEAIRQVQRGWRYVGNLSAADEYFLRTLDGQASVVVKTLWRERLGDLKMPAWVILTQGDAAALCVTDGTCTASDVWEGMTDWDAQTQTWEGIANASLWYIGSLADFNDMFHDSFLGVRGDWDLETLKRLPIPAFSQRYGQHGYVAVENGFSNSEDTVKVILHQAHSELRAFTLLFDHGMNHETLQFVETLPPLETTLMAGEFPNTDAMDEIYPDLEDYLDYLEDDADEPRVYLFDVDNDTEQSLSIEEFNALYETDEFEMVEEAKASFDLGSCCGCGVETSEEGVSHIYLLDYKSPEPGIGCWGCFQCGLPLAGAAAVMCETCHTNGVHPTYAVLGEAKENRRIAVSELTEPFTHDMSKHSEGF